jgi:Trk K+ transport system NAD-binding subunit
VTVPAGREIRPLSAIDLPKGVIIAAVQRGDSIQTTDRSFLLLAGDIVYLVGESNLLDQAAKTIGG